MTALASTNQAMNSSNMILQNIRSIQERIEDLRRRQATGNGVNMMPMASSRATSSMPPPTPLFGSMNASPYAMMPRPMFPLSSNQANKPSLPPLNRDFARMLRQNAASLKRALSLNTTLSEREREEELAGSFSDDIFEPSHSLNVDLDPLPVSEGPILDSEAAVAGKDSAPSVEGSIVPRPSAIPSSIITTSAMPPPKKRQRMEVMGRRSSLESSSSGATVGGGVPQEGQWNSKLQELLRFKEEHGHCRVPHTFPENPSLARWVKRQRYQYKLQQKGSISTMTEERIQALESHGFVWDSHHEAFQIRLKELSEYKEVHGHTSVPGNYSNVKLATWCKCQRRQYRLFQEGKPCNINMERITELEELGFEWNAPTPFSSSTKE